MNWPQKLHKGKICLLLLCLAGPAFAHPGGMDKDRGHVCRSDCSEYGLEKGQYHKHLPGSFDVPEKKEQHLQTEKEKPARTEPGKLSARTTWIISVVVTLALMLLVGTINQLTKGVLYLGRFLGRKISRIKK